MSLICTAERLIVSYWFELSSLEDSDAGFQTLAARATLSGGQFPVHKYGLCQGGGTICQKNSNVI